MKTTEMITTAQKEIIPHLIKALNTWELIDYLTVLETGLEILKDKKEIERVQTAKDEALTHLEDALVRLKDAETEINIIYKKYNMKLEELNELIRLIQETGRFHRFEVSAIMSDKNIVKIAYVTTD